MGLQLVTFNFNYRTYYFFFIQVYNYVYYPVQTGYTRFSFDRLIVRTHCSLSINYPIFGIETIKQLGINLLQDHT